MKRVTGYQPSLQVPDFGPSAPFARLLEMSPEGDDLGGSSSDKPRFRHGRAGFCPAGNS